MKRVAKEKNRKFLKNFFWLGPILSIAGLSARVVSGEWSPVALGLLIAGVVIIGLWLLFLGNLAPGFWRRHSTQVGTNAIIATLAVLAILGLINFLGVRYAQQVDLTENQLFTLSPLSQELAKNLPQRVKVWVFDPQPNPVDRELLENYRRYGSNLEYEFVDPQLRPGLTQQFNVQSRGQVFLEYGPKRQLVQTVSDAERLSEVKLTNGIERVTSDRLDKVYFLQGHGERSLEQEEGGLSQAVSALKDKNFTAQPLNLVDRSEVPTDASLVVIAGPKRALFEQEVEALRNYLSSGGSVLLMIDPETNPGLDSLLADWGVKLDNQIAIDASGQGSSVGLGVATPLVTSYGDHPITREFGNGFSFYPLAQPVETTQVSGITETPLLLTNEQSWAESTPENQPLQFDQGSDRPGPLALGVALSRQAQSPSALLTPTPQATASPGSSPSPSPTGQAKASPSPTPQATASPGSSPSPSPNSQPQASPSLTNKENTQKKSESRLVVLGNSNFATDGWFEQQLNGDVFLNSVSWLTKRDEQALSIRPKEQKSRRINLTAFQAGILGWSALVIMPLVGFTTAGLMWWRRR